MNVKLKPHHDLASVKAKFASGDTLEITRKAVSDAQAIGFELKDIVAVVQA